MLPFLAGIGFMASVTYGPVPVMASTTLPVTIQQAIVASADQYGVSASMMTAILKCESGMRPDAVGDHGTSFGIAQIHLSAHPDVTKEQALDPLFSIDFLAREMKANRVWQWSCHKIIYGT